MICKNMSRSTSQALVVPAGMLASDGRCKTLDACADGYVRAEDCAILMLEEATEETDSQVLLSGSAVNQVLLMTDRFQARVVACTHLLIDTSMRCQH